MKEESWGRVVAPFVVRLFGLLRFLLANKSAQLGNSLEAFI